MTARERDSLEAAWARLGVLLQCAPASRSPDLERVLLETARSVGGNARLYPLVVSWLAGYGGFVAKHRLKRLIVAELEPEHQAALGLILETALAHGAARDLSVPLEACVRRTVAGPLFAAQQADAGLRAIAEKHATAVSRQWGVWAPEVELKRDAVRPVGWLLEQNPGYRERIVRKGDLRCSILETLRLDTDGRARSESELARLSGATRTAVRKALEALVQEGEVSVAKEHGNDRDHVVVLRRAA